MTPEERIKLRLHVESQQDGGNPSQFLELLAYTTENRIWEQLQTESGEPLTFRRLVELPFPDGIGSSADNILTVITLQHKHEAGSDEIHQRMEAMRREVRRELHEALEDNGGDRRSDKYQIANSKLKTAGGTTVSYAIRRLKRDAPELAEKVISGELSANEAAIAAGFRERTVTISLDLDKAAHQLIRRFDAYKLIDAIARAAGDNDASTIR